MKGLIEILLFAALAVFIHVVLFSTAPAPDSASGGASGTEVVSIAAAAATVAEMVETWQAPPQIQTEQPDFRAPPPVAAQSPQMPQIELSQAPRVKMQVALTPQTPPENPNIQTAPASPPPPPPPPKPKPPTPEKARQKPPKPAPQTKVATKAATTNDGRTKQRAAGTGGQAFAGSGKSVAGAASKGKQKSLKSAWAARIRRHLERSKRCPRNTPGTGTTVIRITIGHSGKLINYRVARSSGVSAFDQAALRSVSRAGRFPPAPKGLTSQTFGVTVPLKFRKCG
ncbi:MAG: TonB family protein [Rhodobacteraceae bacterium]|nr:TonB family protein [Paracoccaceae bacterium]